jgi:hypothetical protein
VETWVSGKGDLELAHCVNNIAIIIAGAITYAICVAVVFVFLSWLVMEINGLECCRCYCNDAFTPHVKTLATIYAESLGIAMGWTTFNMINVIFKCEFPGACCCFCAQTGRSSRR